MKKIIKSTLILLCMSLVVLSFASCGFTDKNGITLEEFNKIENGMTYEEVCEIIGCEGELMSEADLNIGSQYATEIYSWKGEVGIGANATVTFQGGKVVSKAQAGLQ